jgi:predicted thioesterase
MLSLGIKGSQSVEVNESNTADALGSGDLPVFATPAMIALIERTACQSLIPYLEVGSSTVGTHLDIAHSSATPTGMTVVCETELVEIDRRRLVFKVHVYDSAGEVGSGTHERFVVDAQRFLEKASLKLNRSSPL